MLIDLHTHSSQSDGSLSPEELVDKAAAEGIKVLALCDHDTTAGLARFTRHAQQRGVTAVAGIELSAEWPKGNCHILGLGVRVDFAPLESLLHKVRAGRDDRNSIILQKLHEHGVVLSIEDVERYSGGDVIARPHIARAMVDKGYVGSVQEAFDRYLAKGKPGYVDRFRLDPPDAVRILKEAGARVVLAHPTQLNLAPDALRTFIAELAERGLDGIEVFTPHTESDEDILLFSELARTFSLAVSGGSDFHGASKPAHRLGFYRERTPIPAELSVLKFRE